MAFAGFSPGEAEGLRRAMSRKRSDAAIAAFHERFVEGAARAHGADRATAERVWEMIEGFSGFGFPKAHGAAFGLLAYQSTWLRVHHPAPFLCALLNEQPMGFYPPDALVHDAQRRGIEVRAPEINASEVECEVEEGAVRVGLAYVNGVRKDDVEALVAAREAGGRFRSLGDLAARAGAGRAALELLAWSGTCDALGRGTGARSCGSSGSPPRDGACRAGPSSPCPSSFRRHRPCGRLEPWSSLVADYATTGMTVRDHPLSLLRPSLPADAVTSTRPPPPPPRPAREDRRAGRRPPASRDGRGHRLPAHRGRARNDQPDRPAAGLRAPPRHGPHRAARARRGQRSSACPQRAGRSTCSSTAIGPIDVPDRPLAEVKDFHPARGEGASAGRRRSSRRPTSAPSRPRCSASRAVGGAEHRGRLLVAHLTEVVVELADGEELRRLDDRRERATSTPASSQRANAGAAATGTATATCAAPLPAHGGRAPWPSSGRSPDRRRPPPRSRPASSTGGRSPRRRHACARAQLELHRDHASSGSPSGSTTPSSLTAPSAYSGWRGCPTLRTTSASSGAPSAAATSAATGIPPRASPRTTTSPSRRWERGGQPAPRVGAVGEVRRARHGADRTPHRRAARQPAPARPLPACRPLAIRSRPP